MRTTVPRTRGDEQYLGLIAPDKTETRHPIQGLNEIYNYAAKIKETFGCYEQVQQ